MTYYDTYIVTAGIVAYPATAAVRTIETGVTDN